MNIKLKVAIVGLIIIGLSWLIVKFAMYKYIQPNEVGIWMTNGGMNGQSDYQVWQGHFPVDINPLTKGFILPAQPWTVDLPEKVILSKENGEWTIDPSFTFSVDRSQAPFVCWKYNSYIAAGQDKFLENIGEHILTPVVNNVFVEFIGLNRDTFMMSEKITVAKAIEDSVAVAFKRHGFILTNFVTGITPPKSILETNRAKNEALQAVYKAKADTENANAQAQVKVATARADAEAMLVTARAHAEATRLQQQVLTPLMIQQMWIEKWNGALPTYSGEGVPMIQIQH